MPNNWRIITLYTSAIEILLEPMVTANNNETINATDSRTNKVIKDMFPLSKPFLNVLFFILIDLVPDINLRQNYGFHQWYERRLHTYHLT